MKRKRWIAVIYFVIANLVLMSTAVSSFGTENISQGAIETGIPEVIETPGLAADTLRITVGYFGGPYYEKKIFSKADLQSMEVVKQAYTYIDNMPSVVIESAEGVRLSDILEASGIDINSVESFHFYCKDVGNSWYQSLSKVWLLDTGRYYYGNLPEAWDYDLEIAGEGAENNKTAVTTIIAFSDNWRRFATEPDFSRLIGDNCFRLVFGQTDTSTITATKSAKWIHTIEVTLGGTPIDTVQSNEGIEEAEVGSEKAEDIISADTTAQVKAAGVQPWRMYKMSETAQALPEVMARDMTLQVAVTIALLLTVGAAVCILHYFREVKRKK